MTDGRPVVALDTNALMMPVELGIRTFEEIERLIGAAHLVVPRAVMAELERFTRDGTPKEKSAASVGLSLAEDRCAVIGEKSVQADDEIAALAATASVDYVVTNDAPLRKQVLDAGIPVISLRGRTKLEVLRP